MKKTKGKAFIIDCGMFPDQITVFVNMSKEDAVAFMKKQRFHSKLIEVVLEREAFWEENIPVTYWLSNQKQTKDAFFMRLPNIDYKKKGSVMQYFGTFVHEATHATDFILELRGAGKEQEARAYLTEYIFRQIVANL